MTASTTFDVVFVGAGHKAISTRFQNQPARGRSGRETRVPSAGSTRVAIHNRAHHQPQQKDTP